MKKRERKKDESQGADSMRYVWMSNMVWKFVAGHTLRHNKVNDVIRDSGCVWGFKMLKNGGAVWCCWRYPCLWKYTDVRAAITGGMTVINYQIHRLCHKLCYTQNSCMIQNARYSMLLFIELLKMMNFFREAENNLSREKKGGKNYEACCSATKKWFNIGRKLHAQIW